jgi:hypothetical protein
VYHPDDDTRAQEGTVSKTYRRMTTEQLREVQERRRSGAAGRHADSRTRRTRTRSAATRRAIREY